MTGIAIFNRDHIRRQRKKSAGDFDQYCFLYDWCEEDVIDRLSIIKRSFPTTILLNDRSSKDFREELAEQKQITSLISLVEHRGEDTDNNCILYDGEILPLASQSADLIISILDLHTINDLPGMLIQIRQALKPDGLFIACMPGGETLHQLRESLMQAELSLSGGASPRVFPFADKQQMGALLQRAGFALPVVDSDIITVAYRDIFHLMYDLKGMGEGNSVGERRKTLTPKALFMAAQEIYAEKFTDDDGKLPASFEIISLIGWAPHQAQPQPLRPGSATARLAAVLGTEEFKTEN